MLPSTLFFGVRGRQVGLHPPCKNPCAWASILPRLLRRLCQHNGCGEARTVDYAWWCAMVQTCADVWPGEWCCR
jgi:hypothetical protein